MGFSSSDKKEVERILSNLTGTLDAVGKAKRDVNLIIKVHRDWPTPVFAGLMAYLDLFQGVLSVANNLESTLLLAAEDAITIPEPEG